MKRLKSAPKKHRIPLGHQGRRPRTVSPRILIVCEGEKTEPNYFTAMNQRLRINAKVDFEPHAGNTLSVIERADELSSSGEYNEIWCVFDKDDFRNDKFDNAVHKAIGKGFKVAFSNESFELWYVLHFQFHTSASHRDEYYPIIERHLGIKKYRKNSSDMDALLADKIPVAKRNASRRHKECTDQESSYARMNPCTTVYLLVERLEELSR